MPLGYDTVVVRHLISGEKLELYAADAVQYLEHPWFSQYYIIDGPLPVSGIIPIIFGVSGNATKVVNDNLAGIIPITFGVSGTVSKRSNASGTVPIIFDASGNTTFPIITGTFTQVAGSASDTTTYTFTAQPIGTASATRRVVVGVCLRNLGGDVDPVTVTIGGISATQDGAASDGTAHSKIFSAVVSTGTTADIVVTTGGNTSSGCGIGVWWLDRGSASGQVVADNTAGTPVSLVLTTQANDFVVAVVHYRTSSSVSPWLTFTTGTKRYDQSFDGLVRQHGAADFTATGTSTDMSASIDNYSTNSSGVAVGYR